MDNPEQLPYSQGLAHNPSGVFLNFFDLDACQNNPIKILNVLTPDEAYTHPHEWVRLAAKAVKKGEEPLNFINNWEKRSQTVK